MSVEWEQSEGRELDEAVACYALWFAGYVDYSSLKLKCLCNEENYIETVWPNRNNRTVP